MIQGVSLETIYFYALLICAVLAVLLVVFGDVFDFDGPLDPMLFVPWVAFVGLFGYLGEHFFAGRSLLVFIAAAVISTILVFLLNFYILIPMKQAEATISSSEKDLEGVIAIVTIPIPVRGMGEVQIKSVTGSVNRPAAFYAGQEEVLPSGAKVLIIEVRERVCYVVPYDKKLI